MLFLYADKIAKKFIKNDSVGSATTIQETIRNLQHYTEKKQLLFEEITPDFLKSYETWYLKQTNQKGENNTINGLGFRLREIRLIFNLAIKDKDTYVSESMYPFGRYGYSIKKEKTRHRDINAAQIAKLYDLKITPETKLWHHQNYFKFYFECWGMNFADIAYLKVYQVQKGRLTYRRRKTRWSANAKKFDITLSSIALEIFNYYAKDKKPEQLVFSILEDVINCGDNEAIHKKLCARRSNHIRRLKTIAIKAGVDEKLSTYVSRHSFFSIALKSGVSKPSISEMAGHANFQITETYLSGFKKEQLAANADMVRNAVSQYIEAEDQGSTDNILDEVILLKDGSSSLKINDFLSNNLSSSKPPDSTELVIKILSETNCQDGTKAQQYVDTFLGKIKK